MLPLSIRDGTAADIETMRLLNDAELAGVTPLAAEMAARFLEQATVRVATSSDEVAGFVVALLLDTDYESGNYRWFAERYDDVIYVDRIVVAPAARRRGVGRALYFDLAEQRLAPAIGCEVNIEPPNPGSLAFHHGIGFREVGQRDTNYGKRVSMLRWDPLSGESP